MKARASLDRVGLDSIRMSEPQKQRLDKWLWFVRVVKSRTLAAKLVTEGHVRINGKRQDSASKTVTPGDVLTIALERDVRVLKVIAPGERRGPYEEARLLYEDLTPPKADITPGVALADPPGAGRPTKKDRRDMERDIDKWRGEN